MKTSTVDEFNNWYSHKLEVIINNRLRYNLT